VIQNATAKYVPDTVPYYQFVVLSGSTTVYDSGMVAAGTSQTSHRVASGALKAETPYTWKARGAASATASGPWSSAISFTTPKSGGVAYQTATTLWDPLTDEKSIGTATGMEFTKDVGARTIGNDSIFADLLRRLARANTILCAT
jgi:hypothetical protein